MINPIYLVRTHKYDPATIAMVHQLANDVGAENVIVFYDDTRVKLPTGGVPAIDAVLTERTPVVTLTYNSADASTFNRYHVSMWHNGHEPLILLGKAVKYDYDYVIMLEYDVRCLGNFKTAFEKVNGNDADYLANYMGDHKKFPDLLWNSFVGDEDRIPPMEERRVGLFAVVRCSKRLIDALVANINVYDAYCEIYVPTLAKQLGMSEREFPPEILGHFAPMTFKDIKGWSEYVGSHPADDRLYHAIKD